MADFYTLKFLGLERELPILPAPSGINIAGFNSVGDIELLTKSAEYLVGEIQKQNIEFDVILTTELKGIPISQEVGRLLKKDYVCLRKAKKCYMLDPISVSSESITSGKVEYFVSSPEFAKLSGKKVLFVDDVFSTGATFKNIMTFAERSGFDITAGAFILKEVPKNALDEPLNFDFNGTKVLCCSVLPLP